MYVCIIDDASIEAFKLMIKLTTPKRRKDALDHVLLSVKVQLSLP